MSAVIVSNRLRFNGLMPFCGGGRGRHKMPETGTITATPNNHKIARKSRHAGYLLTLK